MTEHDQYYVLMDRIEILRDCVNVQKSPGNWNCNPYMMGMGNGLILALAIMEDTECHYLNRPDVWLDDKKIEPVASSTSERPTSVEQCALKKCPHPDFCDEMSRCDAYTEVSNKKI